MGFGSEENDAVLFGGDVPPEIRPLIEQARQQGGERAATLLWQANEAQPDCLPVHYLLYKLHAGRREFELAERAAILGLAQAGKRAGLPTDWRTVDPAELIRVDFSEEGPARFWLFTLKALAFISLRRGHRDAAERVLALLATLDPSHSVGSAVTQALLVGSA